ncbi:AraC family transcriptional regulator [Halothermothrix orenii]|uniref:Transcription activator effector binding n=1 Tax=Halothermothrix orenii (strain H 168 / OCM 544 / DSM 9562) TaxID=373903 RepID=B8D1P7_HALOH|nr:effector binding domain-containing protein [Halothermothrix orenii]ACL69124.1 transcription activator effector binding [Halothermothrix orenii H 168]
MEILIAKVKEMNQDLQELKNKKEIIEQFIFTLENNNHRNLCKALEILQRKYTAIKNGMKQVEKKSREGEGELKRLTDSEVRIVELKPVWVASYRAEAESPEPRAWEVIFKWAKKYNLLQLPGTRFFGFDNPSPTPDKAVYGYEFWVTIPHKNFNIPEEMKIRKFSGGLYAVTNTNFREFDVGERWKQLYKWVKESEFSYREGICLEEHITLTGYNLDINTVQLDLYEPIKP